MTKYDSLLDSFSSSLPDQIEKPAHMSFNEFLVAQSAKWGEFTSIISRAGRLAKDKYGPDVWIDTSMGKFDPQGQVHHAFIDLQRPGVTKQQIPMSMTLDHITIDGVTYSEAELDQAAEVVLGRINSFLTQPISGS